MGVLALAVAACDGDDDALPVTTAPDVTTTTIEPRRVSDNQLTLGVLLPAAETLLRDPLNNAVDEAVTRINTGGEVLGRPIRVVRADEGTTAASASAAVETLLSNGVDAIIGPVSSSAALTTLASIVNNDVLACSPTASALALDDFPGRELFFRTIPSDSLQAEAIAQVAAETGTATAAIVYVDDAYGRPYAEAVEAALNTRQITVTESIGFPADEEPIDAARELVASGARVAIVLANAADGVRFLATLDGTANNVAISDIIVNDAVRDPASAQRIGALDGGFRERIDGIAPQAVQPDDTSGPQGPFATNAYDCVNLIALSAERVQSDVPRDIAGQMAAVSSGGSPCRSFAECSEALQDGLQINYNGPSGLTELSVQQRDPSQAWFERFSFDDEGRDQIADTFVVRV